MLTPSQATMYRKMTIGDDTLMTLLLAGAEVGSTPSAIARHRWSAWPP